MTNRYDIDPKRLEGKKDIFDYIKDIKDRTDTQETGLRAGHTAIEDGDFILRNGDIVVSESDNSIVLRILHGAIPQIHFFPLGATDTHRARILSLDFDVGAGADQAIQMGVETVGGVQDGGKVLLSKTYAILAHQPNGGNESYFWLNILPEMILYRGKWNNQVQQDSRTGIYPGTVDLGAGFAGVTISYAITVASTMVPVTTIMSSAAVTWNLSAFNTNGFTLVWSGTTAKTINWWAFRV